MIKYRISKYNPIYRDRNGTFQNDEWTAVSDIGKKYNDKELSKEEYLAIEKKYIRVLKIIMKEKGINKFIVKELEKEFMLSEVCKQLEEVQIVVSKEERYQFREIEEDYTIKYSKVDSILKLLLREGLWCRLMDIESNFSVEIGYEYYMYVTCSELSNLVISKIQNNELFIEEFDID
ncbi:hypothetical protein KPL40_05350 [Clostridium gasigenes]|uniref:hypothetical protein n=1 Tax=Clostridium gasigenes TaxID=94869 RepID=UPI001C0E2A39|nr:hypothetical protein [Clostridium gasigenes]MBU3131872.1 hypothetical protein [Clostridium gasigenes]